jgi:hypothetical protein
MKFRRRFSNPSRTGKPAENRRPFKRNSLWLEALEDRMAPAVYNVTGLADGAGMVTQTSPGVFNATTLRAAVTAADASADAANTINLAAGTYNLTLSPSQLNLTNNMTIQGAGDTTTIIDAGQNGRAFFIPSTDNAQTVTLDGMTIQNGKAPVGDVNGANNAFGGGIVNEETLNLNNVIVTANLAQGASVNGVGGNGEGGGIYNQGTLIIQNSVISNNQAIAGASTVAMGQVFGAQALGGGIFNASSSNQALTLTNSTISGNVAVGGSATAAPNGHGYGGHASGGGIASQYAPLTLTNVTFSSNQVTGGNGVGQLSGQGGSANGGALYDSDYGALTIQGSYFSGNQVTGGTGSNPAGVNGGANYVDLGGYAEGGAIYNRSGNTISISSSTLTGNSATGGAASGGGTKPTGGTASGGAFLDRGGEGGSLTMTSCTLSGNVATGGTGTQTNFQTGFGGKAYGGGLTNQSGYPATITDTTFSANQAEGGNGTGDYGGAGAAAQGGGLFTINGQMTILDSTFSGNLATGGNGSDTKTYFGASNYPVTGGTASGASIALIGGNLTISNSTLSSNRALGGTVSTYPAAYGVGGGAYGGGIYGGPGNGNNALAILLTNSTIDSNQALGGAGGKANLNGSGAGGGVYVSIKTLLAATLESTIVANDSTAGGFGPDVFGDFVSKGFNLIGSIDATAQGFTNGMNGDQVGTVAAPLNPNLGFLTNNGGPTQTQNLNLGSPALGKGANPNNLANDQRGPGFPRTVNGSTDVGAFQAQLTQISGFVYNDANDNGVFDAGEKGIAGVTVTLTGLDFNNTAVSLTTVTLADGSFVFPNLNPASEGGYKLTETPPAGFLDGQASVPNGQTGMVQSSHVIAFINLQFGFSLANYDFGQISPSSLGGFVFIDANKNGMFDPGESGFPNATVTLTGSDDHEQNVNLTVQTNAAGAYNFGNLRPGTYTITLTPPAGNFVRGANIQGTPGNGTVGANSFDNITLVAPGVIGANNDFAEISLSGNIAANGLPVSATEGLQFTALVATFTDSDGDPVGHFTASVNWGDGTTSQGTVSAAAAGFAVSGTHTYSEKGIYTIVVTINDTDGSSAPARSTATVADAALSLASLSFSAFPGLQKNNLVVASFTDAGGLKPVTEYTATINWGDGTAATNGRIVLAGNAVHVVGDHKYALEGFFTVTTTVTDVGGQTGPGVANATAVSSLQVLVGGYVTSLYAALLNRLPDAPGLAGWVQALQNGTTRTQVAAAFFVSPEHRGIEVDQLYVLILHRPSDPGGRAIWVAQLVGGMSENQIAIQFLVSPEYTASHSSIPAFVTGLYSDILGRAADAQGFSLWTQILQNGARTRAGVAYYFLSSGEALADAITSYYEDFLSRAPDGAGLQGFLQALESGKSSTAQIVGEILGSQEYLGLITARASG